MIAIQRYFAEEREEEIGEVAAINIAGQRAQLLEEDIFALEKRI